MTGFLGPALSAKIVRTSILVFRIQFIKMLGISRGRQVFEYIERCILVKYTVECLLNLVCNDASYEVQKRSSVLLRFIPYIPAFIILSYFFVNFAIKIYSPNATSTLDLYAPAPPVRLQNSGLLALNSTGASHVVHVARLALDHKGDRLRLGVREDWLFILGMNMDENWQAFWPDVEDWVRIPSCPSDFVFHNCDKELVVAGLNLLVFGQSKDGYVTWKFNTINRQWSTTSRMTPDRCVFGSATFGKYAYFAGGVSQGTLLKSAERYDSETNSWESLADMKDGRKECSGFVMDGKFHVIGGRASTRRLCTSGEVYDPQVGTWTVIEGMWPQQFAPNTQVSPPLVAVLNNQLYAINIVHSMLMLYDKEHNSWRMLERVPFMAENTNGWGLGFVSVGDELFVVGGAIGPGQFLPKIHAYRPRVEGSGENWRHVTDLPIREISNFICSCAVMSG